MLPHLLHAANAGLQEIGVSRPVPPSRFRAAEGVRQARLVFGGRPSPAGSLRPLTEAQKSGLRYEKKALDFLARELALNAEPPRELLRSPWISFTDRTGSRLCQPDALIDIPSENRTVVVEIKLRHMPEAWWQLRKLYEPVAREARPGHQIALLCVTKSFDPFVSWGEVPTLFSTLEDFLSERSSSKIGVLEWKP